MTEPLRRIPPAAFGAEPIWLRPLGLLSGAAAEAALAGDLGMPLAGGPIVFTSCELLARRADGIVAAVAPVADLLHWRGPAAARIGEQLGALTAKRPEWAGFALERPLVMGILNTTPDSFSDGGAFLAAADAVAQGRALVAAGADIVDVGGESTRPGAAPVTPEEEMRRTLPVVEALAKEGALVSIDTRHAAVMQAALAAGARIVNDVSALGDKGAIELVARAGAAIVLMHMQGEPQTMQRAPAYRLASLDVLDYLAERIALCAAGGIPRSRLIVDPGIGFGKTQAHNFEILARLALFHATGAGLLVGLSRKSLVGRLAGAAVDARLPGSLAGALYAVSQGAQIVRVHDVAETRQALLFQGAVAAGA